MSMIEAATNVIAGYGVAVAMQNLKFGLAATIVNIAKSYMLRRLFAG